MNFAKVALKVSGSLHYSVVQVYSLQSYVHLVLKVDTINYVWCPSTVLVTPYFLLLIIPLAFFSLLSEMPLLGFVPLSSNILLSRDFKKKTNNAVSL